MPVPTPEAKPTAYVALLRGVNVGGHRHLPMADLRGALTVDGHQHVSTYVQSGNLVLASELGPGELACRIEGVLAAQFGLPDVPVVVRSRAALARVAAGNPFPAQLTDPKRLQVSFLSAEPSPTVREALLAADVTPDQVHLGTREIYAWHPDGVQRSKLARLLTDRRLGVTATARNWTTVVTLLAMAEELQAA